MSVPLVPRGVALSCTANFYTFPHGRKDRRGAASVRPSRAYALGARAYARCVRLPRLQKLKRIGFKTPSITKEAAQKRAIERRPPCALFCRALITAAPARYMQRAQGRPRSELHGLAHTNLPLILISSIEQVVNELSCRCEGSGSQPPAKRQKARCPHGWRASNEKKDDYYVKLKPLSKVLNIVARQR